MEKIDVITKLGNIIMSCTPCVIDKKDKDVLFEAYKLLSDYYHEELASTSKETNGWTEFAKFMAEREEESEYQKWKDEYVHQMLWFYDTLGLENVHASGDMLFFDQNDIFGYDLRSMYESFKNSDEQ